MYPTLYHALLDLTGLDWPVLKFLNSFGFMVALAFAGAYITLTWEFQRKTREGVLRPTPRTIVVGAPPTPAEYVVQGLIGFIVGFKGLHVLLYTQEVTADPPGFLLSGQGSFVGGWPARPSSAGCSGARNSAPRRRNRSNARSWCPPCSMRATSR